MALRHVFRFSTTSLICALAVACGGDDGDGGDGDVVAGDGDGDVVAGDGDGDVVAGDGDGDVVAGDGDGDVTGDGDGDTYVGFGREIRGGQTRDGYSTDQIMIGGEQYYITTNPWGGAEQLIIGGGENVFTVESYVAPEGAAAWDVGSFPSVFKGASYDGTRSAESGMPIQVSAIESVRTGLSSNASQIPYNGNTTYDVYFTNAEGYNLDGDGPPDVYLMVWFHSNAINPINNGEGYSCSSEPPTHIEGCTDGGSVEIGGKVFHRFIGPNGSSSVISYAPEVNFDEWEFELKDFIDDAVAQGVLTPDLYLQSVQGGFEIIDAGAGLTIHDYYVDVNP